MAQDKQSRKWLYTFNNPAEHGYTHERIKEALLGVTSLVYWCMADEQGVAENTPHTHLYAHFQNPKLESTMRNIFPKVHLDLCRGKAQEIYEYVTKTGNHKDTDKEQTRIDGTFEEWGELPEDRQGRRNDALYFRELIKEGRSNVELYEENPEYMFHGGMIERVRQDYLWEKYRKEDRPLDVSYIYGETGIGKTSLIIEKHGLENVCRVTDYNHPFDIYRNEPVIVFDEFESKLTITDMNNYLDRYPLVLPARYRGKQACYLTVYVVSNSPLNRQYQNVQHEKPDVWKAFLRRFHHLYMMDGNGLQEIDIEKHTGVKIRKQEQVEDVPDWVKQIDKDIEDGNIEWFEAPF
jgi:hypothetical protein